MTKEEAVNWIINLSADIGKKQHQDLWHYEQALAEIKDMLEAKPGRKTGRTKAIPTARSCVDLAEKVTATFYDEEHEEWTCQTVTIADVLDSVCDDYTILPSAEPEIIHCKDCKYRDENWRRVSVRWLPCMDVRTGSNWYCGSAERREEDERFNKQTGSY